MGKTVVTALLLYHLRQTGVRALAMKPFCSGDRRDVNLFQTLQDSALPDEQINPYFFDEPLAPLVAARHQQLRITRSEVLRKIRSVAGKCECLLVEGAGGVLVPLSQGLMVIDLIRRLSPAVVLVARNRLGTINHTLLTAMALRAAGVRRFKSVLVDLVRADVSSQTNLSILRELLEPNPVLSLPYLGAKLDGLKAIKKKCTRLKNLLACLAA